MFLCSGVTMKNHFRFQLKPLLLTVCGVVHYIDSCSGWQQRKAAAHFLHVDSLYENQLHKTLFRFTTETLCVHRFQWELKSCAWFCFMNPNHWKNSHMHTPGFRNHKTPVCMSPLIRFVNRKRKKTKKCRVRERGLHSRSSRHHERLHYSRMWLFIAHTSLIHHMFLLSERQKHNQLFSFASQ